jgi:nucleoside-diphosphate-sugar epimerase
LTGIPGLVSEFKMRVLLTGATGFVGRHTLDALLSKGVEVVASTRAQPGPKRDGLRWVAADLSDSRSLGHLVREARASHLVHLGWRAVYGDVSNSRENIDWLRHSLLLATEFIDAGGTRIVGCGSCFEYDWSFGICKEDATPLAPTTLYGASKNALRQALEGLARQAKIDLGWARVFFIYGHDENPSRLVATVISSLLTGRPAETSHGRQIRDYLHVDDVAAGLVALTFSNAVGAFNIASGNTMTLKDIILEAANQVGRPDLVRLGAIPAQAFEPPIIVGDPTKTRETLGFQTKIDLASGIAQTIAKFRADRNGRQN